MANETETAAKIGGVKTIEVAAPKTATGTDEKGAKTGYRKMTVEFNFGDSLQEAIDEFGEDVVFAGFVSSATIDLQNFIRTKLEERVKVDGADGKKVETPDAANSDADIATAFADWKPGIKSRERVSPMDKIKKALGALSEDQKAALIASLTA